MYPFTNPPAVMGHRGAPLLAPENTPASFAAAADAGAGWVELDVRRSAEGILVVRHDARMPDGREVFRCTADELAARGVWTFEAVLEALPAGVGADVEVKNFPGEPDFDEEERAAGLVVEALRHRLDERPWMTSSFSPLTVAVLSSALEAVPAGLVHTAATGMADARAVADDHGARVLCPEVGCPDLDAEGIAAAHEAGYAVVVWTVDDVAEAAALADAGADAICTNHPEALVARFGVHA